MYGTIGKVKKIMIFCDSYPGWAVKGHILGPNSSKYRYFGISSKFFPNKSYPLPPYPGHESQKNHFCFTSAIVPYILYCLKVIFWWFGRIYWGQILKKYQNTQILAPKCDQSLPYPGHESQKNHYFFYFCSSSIYIVLPKGNFFVVWQDFFEEKF